MHIDAHCHLDDPRFDARRGALVAEARRTGIGGWVVAGVDPEQWVRADQLAREVPGVIPVFGLHPWAVCRMTPAEIEAALAQLPGLVRHGLGETGLDASKYVPRGSLPVQVEAFRAQLAIARELDVPVVLHVLGPHAETLAILEGDGVPAAGGMIHSYSGSAELVPRYEALGLRISFSASVTRPTARKVLEAVVRVSPNRLLIETDCPDQPPHGRPGALNEPSWLWDVATVVGGLRNESAEVVLARSTANVLSLFGIIALDDPPLGA